MIRRLFRWMFGKKDGPKGTSDRTYRILFWLLVIAVVVVVLAIWFNWVLYFLLTFVAGGLTGILLERRRRRQILREAEVEQSRGLFGWRRKKKPEAPPEDSPEREPSSQAGKEI